MVSVTGLLRSRLRLVLAITVITLGLSLVSLHARAASGLVAAYNFDEGTGTTVADSSGNGNTGTVSNTTWSTAGKYGKALVFNGTNSWVTIPNSNSLHLTTGMTLEAWVNPTSNQTGVWQSVIMKEHTGDLDYALYKANGTGKPEGVVYTTAEHELPGVSNLALNTWAHLSETYDGTTMRLYVNGVQVASKAQTGSINVSTGALRIGGDSIWGEYFKGMIDDVRIYNRALSVTEIQTDMNTPVGGAADTTPPSAPGGLNQTGSTMTSATLGWTASTDNVGVTGYDTYLNSLPVSTTVTGTSYTFTGLACGQTYPVAVDAYDAAGNHSTQSSSTITTAACDTTPPSTPTNLTQTGSTATSASVSWTASTDNVGVTGYGLYNNGSLVSSTTATNATFSGLACGQTYPIAVDAVDAAGNRSAQATLSVTTATCNDTTPPTTPTGLSQTGAAATSVTVGWTASTDNVGVAGYGLYDNGASAGSTTSTSATISGLTCNTTYSIGVDAFDASGNRSTQATVSATTAACPDTTAPTVSLTAPAAGATVSGSAVAVSANASDNVAVASVQFKLDGANLGAAITTAPYNLNWDTTAVSNGSHALTAVATDTSGNSTTSTAVNVTVSNSGGSGQVPLNTASFDSRVTVGHGFVEASARQIIRTSNDVVYVITSDDSTNPAAIRVWKGSPAGIPTSFAEVDAAHHPTASKIGSPDTRLNRNNVIQMAYNDESNHDLYYQTFNTNTDTWGSRSLEATNAETGLNDGSQGDRTGNVAIILDGNDNPNIAYTTTTNLVVYIPSSGTSGSFGTPQTVATGTLPIHPALAMDSTGSVDLTWANNTAALGCSSCSTTSPNTSILFAQRSPSGTWGSSETVASGANSNIYLDQSPNIVADSNNVPYIAYIDGANDHLHVAHRIGPNNWGDDSPAPASYAGFVHDPTIYSQGTDIYVMPGHNGNINYGFQYELGGAGGTWSSFQLLDSTENDGSASVRWDPARENDNRVIDTIYFNEDSPTTLFYMAIQPRGSTGGDTTAPTTSITAPVSGATISGSSVAVNATASDNVGVTKVELYVDGTLKATDTTSPYNFTLDTTGLSNGSHSLQTKAYDAAGNIGTSSSIPVTVNNTPPDTTPPTVSLTAPTAGATVSGLTTVSAAASDNVGVTSVQFKLDNVNLGSAVTGSPYNINWDTTAASNGTHSLTAVASDAAGNTATATSVTVTVNNGTADITPPTASITSQPTSPTSATTANFSFTGSDNVTPANQLTFQCSLDGAAFASCTSPQAYSGLAAGSHTFQVEATDQAGNVSTAASYSWTIDTTPPSAPTNLAATAVSSTQVNLTWTAATDNVGVTNYQITRNGVTIATVGNVTSYNNTGLTASTAYTYTVLAVDASGNLGAASNQATATTLPPPDTIPPTVSLSAPANGATVSGSTVTVSANASDNVGVVGVQFKLDGINLGTEVTTSPYSVTWNTTTATNGTHSLTAVARDAAGNTTTSTAVSVTVNNASSGQFLLGDQTLETGNDNNSGGTAEAFRTTATTTSTLNSLTVYLGSSNAASKVIVGLYTNNGSHPGTLLTSGTITTPVKSAWNTVTVAPVSVTSGTTYWIAILSPSGSGTLFFRDKAGTTTGSETSSALNLLTLPVTWTTGSTFTDGPLSAYGQN